LFEYVDEAMEKYKKAVDLAWHPAQNGLILREGDSDRETSSEESIL
jgi:hypothetical protein